MVYAMVFLLVLFILCDWGTLADSRNFRAYKILVERQEFLVCSVELGPQHSELLMVFIQCGLPDLQAPETLARSSSRIEARVQPLKVLAWTMALVCSLDASPMLHLAPCCQYGVGCMLDPLKTAVKLACRRGA